MLQQALVLTKTGGSNPAAKDYLQFLNSSDARVIFHRYGFELPLAKVDDRPQIAGARAQRWEAFICKVDPRSL